MEVNYLRYFYEVAKAGSFTAASRKLRISQSALSKAVALLESHEGVKLFERSKSGVALTAIGHEVLGKSERLFQMLGEIELMCKGAKEKCEGPLRFGVSDHVADYLMPAKVQKLRSLYPDVTPSLFLGTPNEIVAQLLSGEIELGLFFTRVNVSGIRYEPIQDFSMAVVCHPAILDSVKGESGPVLLRKALQSSGFIGSIGSQYQRHPSKDLMDLVKEDIRVTVESNSQENQKRLCLAGAGVAYLARFMVEDEIASGELREIPLRKPSTLQLFLATRVGRDLSVNARALVALIKEA